MRYARLIFAILGLVLCSGVAWGQSFSLPLGPLGNPCPLGSSLQLQYNNGGNCAGSSAFQDSANQLSLRNSTNAQKLDIFSTYTSGSNNAFAQIDTLTANTLSISAGGNGAGANTITKAIFSLNGTIIWDYNNTTPSDFEINKGTVVNGALFVNSNVILNNNNIGFTGVSNSYIGFNADTFICRAAAGVWEASTAAPASCNSNGSLRAIVLGTPNGYLVSTLPAAVAGDRTFVTDAVACTALAPLTGSGSTPFCPVIYNGSVWVGNP